MRLIDADRKWEETECEDNGYKLEYYQGIFALYDQNGTCICEFMPYLPTAYDIDKVIEELEKREEHYVEMLDWQGHMAIVDAIGIAKQGGVADDCCEWKQSESFMAIRTYKIGCCDRTLDLTVRMSEEMKYCPYCGKKIKIKVVE